VLIVDENLNVLNQGEVGEIVMGGAARPPDLYFRPDEAGAKRFVSVKGYDGLYFRSGDLGVWQADGMLEVHGRRDRQVKIHGARIELQEIELGVLRAEQDLAAEAAGDAQHKHATEVAVVAASAGEGLHLRLVAFVASSLAAEATEDARPEQAWAKRLRDRVSRSTLQAYMVPHIMVPLDALPRLPHGKPDMVKLKGQAEVLLKEHEGSESTEVVGSLGAVRAIGKAELVLLRMKDSAFGLITLALLWAHWLPHEPKLYLKWQLLNETQMQVIRFASSIPAWGMVGLMMGCEESLNKGLARIRRQLMDATVLLVVYLLMGWPRACSAGSGFDTFATFHRWSCVAIAYVKVAAAVADGIGGHWLQLALGAAAVASAPYLDRVPLVPRPSSGATAIERVLFEDFAYGDMGLAARILFFYLVGCFVLPRLLAFKASVLKHTRTATRVSVRLICFLAGAGIVWQWMSVDTLVHPDSGRDMPEYYDRFYALRVGAEICQAVLFGAALNGDSWILGLVGRSLTGTYLLHPYISLEMPHILFLASDWHFIVLLGALIWVPLAFSITVGAAGQWLLVRTIIGMASIAKCLAARIILNLQPTSVVLKPA